MARKKEAHLPCNIACFHLLNHYSHHDVVAPLASAVYHALLLCRLDKDAERLVLLREQVQPELFAAIGQPRHRGAAPALKLLPSVFATDGSTKICNSSATQRIRAKLRSDWSTETQLLGKTARGPCQWVSDHARNRSADRGAPQVVAHWDCQRIAKGSVPPKPSGTPGPNPTKKCEELSWLQSSALPAVHRTSSEGSSGC
jgi:hypothetical protein